MIFFYMMRALARYTAHGEILHERRTYERRVSVSRPRLSGPPRG